MFRNRKVFMIYYLKAIKSLADKMQCIPVNPMFCQVVVNTIVMGIFLIYK